MEPSDVPPCRIVADGRAAEVRLAAPDVTVDELADALRLPRSSVVSIDGRAMRRVVPLIRSGMRWGSALTTGPPAPALPSVLARASSEVSGGAEPVARHLDEPAAEVHAGAADAAVWEVAVTVGPACSAWRRLEPGRYVIGRAVGADVRVDDPAIEPYHLAVVAGADGVVQVTQLTGRSPIAVVDRGERVTIDAGSSVVEVRRAPSAVAAEPAARGRIVSAPSDPWRRVVHRAPPAAAPEPSSLPEPPSAPGPRRGTSMTGLIGTAVGAAGAAILAWVMGHVLFVAFALVGAFASLATWGAGWAVDVARHRRAVAAYEGALDGHRDAVIGAHQQALGHHRLTNPGLSDVLTVAERHLGQLWARRPGPGDALRVTCGRGEVPWSAHPSVREGSSASTDGAFGVLDGLPRTLAEVEVPLVLRSGEVVAVCGEATAITALSRALVVQLAVHYGPADWHLVAVVSDVDEWAWARWLPQASLVAAVDDLSTEPTLRDLAEDGSRASVTVLLTDAPDLLASRTGAARRLLDTVHTLGVVLVPEDTTVPAVARRRVDVGSTGVVTSELDGWRARPAGLDAATASRAVRAFAHLVDPECVEADGRLPASIGLGECGFGVPDARTIARTWAAGGMDPAPTVALGRAVDGVVDVDLVRDGPHALIAGTTGSGKSELLRTLVVGLAARYSPDAMNVILVDFKGGSTFDVCARLPHTVGLVTDLEDGLARRALVGLDAELRRRERLLRDADVDDLTSYRAQAGEGRRSPGPPVIPRLVIVIDEFAGLAKEHPDLLAALVAIAQRGRSLGLHLVLATQRPAGVVTDDIRANTNLRLALRVRDRADAIDVVGHELPATFSRRVPGRALLRLGDDELIVFQAASASGPPSVPGERVAVSWVDAPTETSERASASSSVPSELDAWIDAIVEAARVTDVAPVLRPWVDPLPDVLRRADLPTGSEWDDALGAVDDPAAQCRWPLRWDRDAGNLVLAGPLGSGRTSSALTIVAGALRRSTPDELHVYVIDAHGDPRWDDVAALDHTGAVIRADEYERIWRLLTRLVGELDTRRSSRGSAPRILLVIDGYDVVRAAFAGDLHGVAESLDSVLATGPALGVAACLTVSADAAVAATVPAVDRWVSSGTAGMSPARPIPGRVRLAPSGREAQLLAPSRQLARPPTTDGAPAHALRPLPIDILPTEVEHRTVADVAASIATGAVDRSSGGGGELVLAVGLGATDLGPALLHVPPGDHVLIGGTARTGITTALRTVAAAWKEQCPGGVIVEVTPASVGELATRRAAIDPQVHVLVVVDDADGVDDDATSTLASLAASRDPRCTIVAAARLDAVRVAYGHWIRAVARRRCGIILTSPSEIDGELLGATLPRRTVIPPRPGLGWLIDRRGPRLAQIAHTSPAAGDRTGRRRSASPSLHEAGSS